MIVIRGTVRQSGEITIKENKFRKIWLEHQIQRDRDGVPDLRIEELLVPLDRAGKEPKPGETLDVEVRAYASGTKVAYSAIAVVNAKAA